MKIVRLVMALAIVGCATKPRTVVAPPQPAPSNDRGNVAAKLLVDPGGPAARLGPGEEYVQPQFTPGNPLPEYPPELVKLHLPPQTVTARLFVDESRHVTLAASPLQASTEGPYLPQFDANVRAALEKWSVWPPMIRKFKPGPDLDGDGTSDYRVLVDHLVLRAYFDLAFTFEVVNGEAVVRSTPVR